MPIPNDVNADLCHRGCHGLAVVEDVEAKAGLLGHVTRWRVEPWIGGGHEHWARCIRCNITTPVWPQPVGVEMLSAHFCERGISP